jgi:quercetin dioxygenase-like cupin family protein
VSVTRGWLALAAVVVVFSVASNVHAKAPAAAMQPPVTPEDLKWGDSPDLPGVKVSVLTGNPAAKGFYVLRIDIPDGFKIPPHWHPTDEHVTVVSGTFHVAMGDQFDDSKGATLPAGGFAIAPAKMHHYAWATGETIVQVDGEGPFKINYVNPADAPKKTP